MEKQYNNESKSLGVMIDVSRNGVIKVEELKSFALIVKEMGYNNIGLYMEDIYEITEEPYFGHLRGRYSKAELKEINDYMKSIGMVIVPYIQTLAHLKTLFQWSEYKDIKDINDILLVDEPKTYELIDKMFANLRDCFDTDKINIGMDEAFMVGLGKYSKTHGYPDDKVAVLYKHLKKVLIIAQKYGFKPSMWSDLFWHLADKRDLDGYIPEDVTLCHWDYWTDNENRCTENLKKHKRLTNNVSFACGLWTWCGYTPQNRRAQSYIKNAVSACYKNDIREMIATIWGDDGNECSIYAALPALFYCAEKFLYNTPMIEIKRKFKAHFGISYYDFCRLDLPNKIKGATTGNCGRWGLFADPFCGKFDYHIVEGDGEEYKKIARKLAFSAKKAGEFAYLFENTRNLCRVLELKFDLGVKTRSAYLMGDKDKLKKISTKTYPELIKRVKMFYVGIRKQWMKQNKPFGFEVQDLRFGGLLQRLENCRQTILLYLSGELEKIDELEAPVLPFVNDQEKTTNLYDQSHIATISANVVHWRAPYEIL